MKIIWCWRCKIEVPMLDEEEFETCFSEEIVSSCDIYERYGRVLARYEAMTGFAETNINAVYHHRLALYGKPCPSCGKPFRTPQASLCAACGFRRRSNGPV